jgi:uncharacterized protein YggU (UPF0235/DUF167 family)
MFSMAARTERRLASATDGPTYNQPAAAAAIRELAESAGRLTDRATPGARSEALEIAGVGLQAKVRAKPNGGKANAAALALIAGALGLAPSRVHLLRGATSREKSLRIDG